MKFLPVIALTVSAVMTAEVAGMGGTKGGSKMQFGTRTSPLKAPPTNYGDFRGTLRQKAKLIMKDNDAVSSTPLPFYSENATHSTMPETFANIELESVHLMPENRSQVSDDMFHKMMGIETTSIMPLLYDSMDDDVVTSSKLKTKSKSKAKSAKFQQEKEVLSNVVEVPNTTEHPFAIFQQLRDNHFMYGDELQQGQEKEYENLEVEDDAQHKKEVVKAAVHSAKRTIEVRPVEFENLEENKEPQVIEVDAKGIPLEIHFKSSSSPIKLRQMHTPVGEIAEIEHTQSTEEPQRLRHVVHKPIIQEVREIITPYRRIVQQIEPVVEEIHTIVPQSREKDVAPKNDAETESISEFERQKLPKNEDYPAQMKEKDQQHEWKPVKGQNSKIQFVANPQHYYQQQQQVFLQQQQQQHQPQQHQPMPKQITYAYSEFADSFPVSSTPQPEVRSVFQIPQQQPEPELGFEVADFDNNEIAPARLQTVRPQTTVRKMQLPVLQSNNRVVQKSFVPSRQEQRPLARIVQVSGVKGRLQQQQPQQVHQQPQQHQQQFSRYQQAPQQQSQQPMSHRQVNYSPIAEASTRTWNSHQRNGQAVYSWSTVPVRNSMQLQYN